MIRARHIVAVLLALVLAASCRGPRQIPKDDMEEIFYLMFLQDQKLRQSRSIRGLVDTTLVYEGIFESFGYNTDDYLRSLAEYLEEPAKMEKIMGNVATRLEKELKVTRREVEIEKWRDKMLGIYRSRIDTSLRPKLPPRPVDTLMVRFENDSAYLYKEVDSLKLIPRDSLLFLRDSLAVPADTLATPADTLDAPADSL